jgi:hypothetical protein
MPWPGSFSTPVRFSVVSAGILVSDSHELLAPTLLRSQTSPALHEAVASGEVDADAASDHLARI